MLHCNGVARWIMSGEDPLGATVVDEAGGQE